MAMVLCWVGTAFSQSNAPKAFPLKMDFDSKTEPDATWQIIANQAKKVRVFMGGENHREVDFNSLMEYGFMNRLHKYAGYRHYVLELSPARAHYLNRYIRYADTHARDALKGVSSPKYMNLFENLKRWNQSLDSGDRILVHGVDAERFYDLSFERLAEVLRNKMRSKSMPLPDSIAADAMAIVSQANRKFSNRLLNYEESVKNLNESEGFQRDVRDDRIEFSRFDYIECVANIERNWMYYVDFLDSMELISFAAALEGVKEANKWNKDEESASRFHWRETVMYQRFVKALDAHKGGKFFGQFGRCHISETPSDVDCGWYSYESVVNRLAAYYFKSVDSLITVGYFYRDQNPDITAANIEQQAVIQKEIKVLTRPFLQGIILYDLNGVDSDLQELRKKYRFILVNNANNAALSSELPTEDLNTSNSLTAWPLSWTLGYYGLSYLQLQNVGLKDHFNFNSVDFSPKPYLALQHHVNLNYGPFVFGLSGYYGFLKTEQESNAVYSDSLGSLNQRLWGIDLSTGLHFEKGPFSLNVMGRIGTSRLGYTYFQAVERAVQVGEINNLQIHNQSWNAGLNLSIYYRYNNNSGFGIQANTFQNIGNGAWLYTGSNQVYQNLDLNSGLDAWSVSAHLCLFFSN